MVEILSPAMVLLCQVKGPKQHKRDPKSSVSSQGRIPLAQAHHQIFIRLPSKDSLASPSTGDVLEAGEACQGRRCNAQHCGDSRLHCGPSLGQPGETAII